MGTKVKAKAVNLGEVLQDALDSHIKTVRFLLGVGPQPDPSQMADLTIALTRAVDNVRRRPAPAPTSK